MESVASGWLIGILSLENGFKKGDRISLVVVPLLRTFGCWIYGSLSMWWQSNVHCIFKRVLYRMCSALLERNIGASDDTSKLYYLRFPVLHAPCSYQYAQMFTPPGFFFKDDNLFVSIAQLDNNMVCVTFDGYMDVCVAQHWGCKLKMACWIPCWILSPENCLEKEIEFQCWSNHSCELLVTISWFIVHLMAIQCSWWFLRGYFIGRVVHCHRHILEQTSNSYYYRLSVQHVSWTNIHPSSFFQRWQFFLFQLCKWQY